MPSWNRRGELRVPHETQIWFAAGFAPHRRLMMRLPKERASLQSTYVICLFIVQAKPAPNHSEYKPWETAELVCFVACDDGFGLRHLDSVLREQHWELLSVKKADVLDEGKVKAHGGDALAGYESAQRNGFHVLVFPEHFGAGRGRTPFGPPRINERFVDAMIQRAGGRRLTKEECGGIGDENADYLHDGYVIELKEMRKEPLESTDERQQKLATLFAPHFPEDSEVPLDPGVLNERDAHVFWDLIGRPVQNAVKKAGKQIRATKDRLGLRAWKGAIIFVNTGGYTLSGENVHRLAQRYAMKDTSQVQEVFTIAQSYGSNGFDSICNIELFPKPGESSFAEGLYDAFHTQRGQLMHEWIVPTPDGPKDSMEPQVPIQFIALDRLFTWVPDLPPRTWLGEQH